MMNERSQERGEGGRIPRRGFGIRSMNILMLATAAALGTYAGSMLTEALVLVPYWQSLDPDAFHQWYAANAQRLVDYFGRVTVVAGVLVIVMSAVALARRDRRRWYWAAAAALIAICIATFPLYFESANASFAAAPLPAEHLASELSRWSALHWVRTVLSIAAFGAALAACLGESRTTQ